MCLSPSPQEDALQKLITMLAETHFGQQFALAMHYESRLVRPLMHTARARPQASEPAAYHACERSQAPVLTHCTPVRSGLPAMERLEQIDRGGCASQPSPLQACVHARPEAARRPSEPQRARLDDASSLLSPILVRCVAQASPTSSGSGVDGMIEEAMAYPRQARALLRSRAPHTTRRSRTARRVRRTPRNAPCNTPRNTPHTPRTRHVPRHVPRHVHDTYDVPLRVPRFIAVSRTRIHLDIALTPASVGTQVRMQFVYR